MPERPTSTVFVGISVDGFMALPAMVYVPTLDELCAHFQAIAAAT